jgi:hypothetical protein
MGAKRSSRRKHTGSPTLTELKVTSRSTKHTRCSPGKAGWWGQLLVTSLFVFYVNFIPIHLANKMHLDDSRASVADTDLHHDGHDDGDHDADSDQHPPHRASDHTLTFTASTKAPSASVLAVFFLPAIPSILVCEAEPQPPIPIFERLRPPGESLPDPLKPRAPPLV